MKSSEILLVISIVLAVGACTDHQQHAAAQEGGTPEPPAVKRMSMATTGARISALARKTTDCNIESVNGALFEPSVPVVSIAETAKVTGWLIDANRKIVPTGVKLRVETQAGDKAWEQSVAAWGDRGDIVTAYNGVAAYRKSGFQVPLDLGELAAGSYNIYLTYDDQGSEVACGVGRRFDVK